jgi:hypothetical protein
MSRNDVLLDLLIEHLGQLLHSHGRQPLSGGNLDIHIGGRLGHAAGGGVECAVEDSGPR